MNLEEAAQQLHDAGENLILLYAFNSTGKTRLSVEYKNYTKARNEGNHTGVYFNAFSEDLFVWDNDEANENIGIKLDIIFSTLNQFHSLINEDLVIEKLEPYKPKFGFQFNRNENPEIGFDSVTFFHPDEKDTSIKVSRGEERIFVWCFFLALFEVDGWADKQDAHFFIDDPVSSLDDHNVYITTDTLFEIIEKNYLNKRIIISTHHIGLFSILADRLTKGSKSARYKNLTKLVVLKNGENGLELKTPNNGVFLFHLHLAQTIDEATKQQLYVYHFVLLRQLLENISSFLGKGGINFSLTKIGIADPNGVAETINSLSHKDAYKLQFNEMSPKEEDLFNEVFQKILVKYDFKF
jgi:hypothetical protein